MPAPTLPDLSRSHGNAGQLRGTADRETPGWQGRLVDQVFADQGRRRSLTCLQVAMGFELRALIRAAAESRGMGSSAYVRRAVAAFVAEDLDIPFAHVTGLAPPVRADRTHGRAGKEPGTHGPGHDTGDGYGHWHACDGRCVR